jgi:hypothetical protein
MSLTVMSQDVFGRATIQAPAGSVFTWSKSQDAATFVAAPEITGQTWEDNRPTQHYKPPVTRSMGSGSIVFTGDAVALYGQLETGNSVYFSVDGVPVGSVSIGFIVNNRRAIRDEMFWGISGLSGSEHTLTMWSNSGRSVIYDIAHSYRVRDFTALYTDTITYKCVVDGIPHTVAINSGLVPDRRGVAKSILARMMTAYDSSQPFGGTYVEEPIAALAGMYLMADPTQKAAVYSLAITEYNRYLSNSNSSTGIATNHGFNYSMDSRTGYSFFMACKAFRPDYPAFGTQLLAVVDKVVGTYKNSGNYPSTPADAVHLAMGGGGVARRMSFNQVVAYAYACALAYNEPASIWHNNAALHTYIWNLLEVCYADGCFHDNTMPYGLGVDEEEGLMGVFVDPEDSYALFQVPMFWYCADTLQWRPSEVAAVTAWLADRFDNFVTQSLAEPFFYFSAYYNGIQADCALRRLFAYYRTHGAMPSEMVNALYSSGFDTDDYTTWENEYCPDGFNPSTGYASPLSSGPLDCWIFQAAAALNMAGVPVSEWAWGIPIKHPNGTPAGTIKKTNGTPSGAVKRKVGGSWQ